MKETIPVQTRQASAITIALVTALALLVAPVCAPLCAARTCSSGSAQEKCHEMASMQTDGGEQLVVPTKACGASDFSAVLIKTDEQSLLSQDIRSVPAPVSMSGSPTDLLKGLPAASQHSSAPRVPLESAASLPPSTILRI